MRGLLFGLAGAATALFVGTSPIRIPERADERAAQGLVYWQTAETRSHYPALSGLEILVTGGAALLAMAGGVAIASGAPAAKQRKHARRLALLRQRRERQPQLTQLLELPYHRPAQALSQSVWAHYQKLAAQKPLKGLPHGGNVSEAPVATFAIKLHRGPKGLLVFHAVQRDAAPADDGPAPVLWAMTHVRERDYRYAQRHHQAPPHMRISSNSGAAAYTLRALPAAMQNALHDMASNPIMQEGWAHTGQLSSLQDLLQQKEAHAALFGPRLPGPIKLLALNAALPLAADPKSLSEKVRRQAAPIRGWPKHLTEKTRKTAKLRPIRRIFTAASAAATQVTPA